MLLQDDHNFVLFLFAKGTKGEGKLGCFAVEAECHSDSSSVRISLFLLLVKEIMEHALSQQRIKLCAENVQ